MVRKPPVTTYTVLNSAQPHTRKLKRACMACATPLALLMVKSGSKLADAIPPIRCDAAPALAHEV